MNLILPHTIPSLSGTFGIPASSAHNPKMPKEPSSPSRSYAMTADPDKTKIGANVMDKWLIMNKAQCLTRNIRKPGDVGNLNFCTFTQNLNGLISWSFKIPASAYCHPLAFMLKTQHTNSTFPSPHAQAHSSACKRAIFIILINNI
ncbi:MAG: hypothetical protein PHW82_12060 [Bacteroidales bacterium]|nr:hypothetical protein [Bacteroidales bacterium]